MMQGTGPDNPVWFRSVPREGASKELAWALVMTLIPVGIAILMQKPALRQAITMRAAHVSKTFCQGQADMWQAMADKAATAYAKARM